MPRMGFVPLLAVACCGFALPAEAAPPAPRPARAAAPPRPELTRAERSALLAGHTVARPLRFARGEDGRYVGGVSYQMVRASPLEVMVALADARSLPQALPHTLEAELLSRDGRSARMELTQGKGPFVVTYTLHLSQDASGDTIRFWLDPSRPHDVRDVWGFFRVKNAGEGRSLVTVAVAVDLGPGFARLFLEDRVERTILRAPAKIRDFIEPRALASAP